VSCDWYIRCVDCGVDGGVADEANNRDDLMRTLIQHAGELAAVGRLRSVFNGVDVRVEGHYLDLEFFVQHEGHRLRPVDEYGRFDVPCGVVVHCPTCRADVACEEREHDGRFCHGHLVGTAWHRCELRKE
jgi:hypothetical protein